MQQAPGLLLKAAQNGYILVCQNIPQCGKPSAKRLINNSENPFLIYQTMLLYINKIKGLHH